MSSHKRPFSAISQLPPEFSPSVAASSFVCARPFVCAGEGSRAPLQVTLPKLFLPVAQLDSARAAAVKDFAVNGVMLFPRRFLRSPLSGVHINQLKLTNRERQNALGSGFIAKVSSASLQGSGAVRGRHLSLILRRVASVRAAAAVDAAFREGQMLRAACDFAAAAARYQQLLAVGHGPSFAELSWIVIDGREGVVKDAAAGFRFAEQGSLLGCPHSRGVLSYCHVYSYGCHENLQLGLQLARESAAAGSKFGHLMLGALYRDGRGGLALDPARSLIFYGLAAAQGLDAAQFRLGRIYQNGDGVGKSAVEALRWFSMAALQGHPWACFEMGQLYFEGIGVERSQQNALGWFTKALKGGDTDAKYMLEEMLEVGDISIDEEGNITYDHEDEDADQ